MAVTFALNGRVVFSASYGCGDSTGSVSRELEGYIVRVQTGERVYSVKDRGREDPSPVVGEGEHDGGTFELHGQWKDSDHDTGKLSWLGAAIQTVTVTDRVFVAKIFGGGDYGKQDWMVITAARVD